MGLEQAIVRPPRCALVNVSTGESIDCLFNPSQLSEKVSVNWNRLNVPGLSHQVLQYQSTGNRQLSGVEFYLDRLFAAAAPNAPDVMDFRRFLRALTVSPENAQDVAGGAPPRVLIIWPKVLTVETVLTDVEFQFRQFAVDNTVLVYTATCGFEAILDARVTSQQLRREL
jgi:hypothetical protein